MKNQYFGDISDYAKYSLLRAFANDGISIGVNWYLTENDESSDGKHIRYLDNKIQSSYDPELFHCLKSMIEAGERDIISFEKKDMIPGAVYYHEPLYLSSIPLDERKDERDRWHINALSALEEADLVLLDPDNGLREDNGACHCLK
jgi:hypothetical protein